MWSQRRNTLYFAAFLAGCLNLGFFTQAYAQDALPLEIKAYVFFVSQEAMNGYLNEGITRNEFEEMQKKHFVETGLLPPGEPIALKLGDNRVDIPADRYELLQKAGGKQVLVFLFDLNRPKETSGNEASIGRRSYALVTGADSTVKQAQVKEGKWKIPAKAQQFRLIDYRNVTLLKSGQIGYELSLGENQAVKLILNAPSGK